MQNSIESSWKNGQYHSNHPLIIGESGEEKYSYKYVTRMISSLTMLVLHNVKHTLLRFLLETLQTIHQ